MSKNTKPKGLGRVKATSRGFDYIEFKDHNGEPCSLQVSSLALYQQPGISAVWLGCENNSFHPGTKEPLSPRMHLDRERVVRFCPRCENEIDPKVCCCGDSITHASHDSHNPIPMGCTCGYPRR